MPAPDLRIAPLELQALEYQQEGKTEVFQDQSIPRIYTDFEDTNKASVFL